MIVLGNPEFATAMKLVGIEKSFAVRMHDEGAAILKETPKDEFIVASVSVVKMLPELEDFPNTVSVPDNPEEFRKTDDLKEIIRTAVGIDIEM